MHDAVADVLDQRRALSRKSPVGVVVSLLVHLVILLALVITSRSAVDHRTPVINVRLAGVQTAAANATARIAQPTPPATPRPVEKKAEPKKAEEPKKKAPPALKEQETLFGKAAKPKGKAETATATAPPVTTTQPLTPGASFDDSPAGSLPGVGTAGITGLEGGDFPYADYLERMVTLVGRNWLRPQSTADVITVIYFRIQKDGTIKNWEIRKSSGSGVFDRAALRAVIETNPLPRLPLQYTGNYLGVHLTFH